MVMRATNVNLENFKIVRIDSSQRPGLAAVLVFRVPSARQLQPDRITEVEVNK